MDQFYAAPPVTRTLTAAAFGTSLLVYGGILDSRRVLFYLPWIFKFPPQIWRLVTPFLVTGGGLNFLLDLYFMFTYGSALETSSSRFNTAGDFFTYVVFVCSFILLTAGVILGDVIFLSALILAFAYTFAQDKRTGKISFYVIQIPVLFLPWAMLALTLIMGGYPAALKQSTGLLAAHAHEFLTRIYPGFGGGRNYIKTPAIVHKWFGGDRQSTTARGYGTAYRPAAQQQQRQPGGEGSSWTSGLSNVWNGRGQGRRLGGD